ncbi:uncharacterized protein LOC132700076 [Cylas formicarius]|uniref:uncharacterized protein LOC132700076 n=1 Tax=Cylas formicarius TaxID=197179 RepID=UPI0029584B13|nr:uncharacterized protein LOC132700076 [Cylas formicarius]
MRLLVLLVAFAAISHGSNVEISTKKSPLEYQPQRPSYFGQGGGLGQLGQIVPQGEPWPANHQDYTSSTPKTSTSETVTQFPSHFQIHVAEAAASKPPPVNQNAPPSTTITPTTTARVTTSKQPTRPGGGGFWSHLFPAENKPTSPAPQSDEGGGSTAWSPPWKPWFDLLAGFLPHANRLASNGTVCVWETLDAEDDGDLDLDRNLLPCGNGSSLIFVGDQLESLGGLWPSGEQNLNSTKLDLKDRNDEAVTESSLETVSHKLSSLRPTGEGFLGQLEPSGSPWHASANKNSSLSGSKPHLEGRNNITSTKSPLEYVSHKPSFLGPTGGGFLGQLVPSGSPWPASADKNSSLNDYKPNLEDRNDETSTKSPLEYVPHKPSFLGPTGGGFLGQLVPSGSPWPASVDKNSSLNGSKPNLEDRNDETSTKSPLEYVPHKPSFLGPTGGGFLGQLVPSGSPWPASADKNSSLNGSKPNLEDRNDETSTKSPLEYVPHKPSFLGPTGGGFLGQLVPSGSPWPASADKNSSLNGSKPNLEDRNDETSTKSPLEYVPHKPSFLGPTGGGFLGQLVPSGSPWPASVDKNSSLNGSKPNLEDRNDETSTKSPLEYVPHKPSFLGPTGGGFLGQLVPSGSPWPASADKNSSLNGSKPNLEDRNDETSTKSPLEYVPHKPSFLGPTGGGFLGQLVPSGSPWPASADKNSSLNGSKPNLEDINDETSTKSPLEYVPHKPSFLGPTGGGFLGQLVPSGSPWPASADKNSSLNGSKPNLEDRNDETSTKSPLEYVPHKPSFLGPTGGGFLGQLVPSGSPWPASADKNSSLNGSKPNLEDINDETSTKSPLEYVPHKPSFLGPTGGGFLGQLVPSGSPWPASANKNSSLNGSKPNLEDRNDETSTKSPLEYVPHKPSFLGPTGGGFLGQLINYVRSTKCPLDTVPQNLVYLDPPIGSLKEAHSRLVNISRIS